MAPEQEVDQSDVTYEVSGPELARAIGPALLKDADFLKGLANSAQFWQFVQQSSTAMAVLGPMIKQTAGSAVAAGINR